MTTAFPSPLAAVLAAATFAAEKHRTQRRKGANADPYINHPLAVARLLAVDAGIEDVVVLQAALLHDTVEDTQTTFEELARLFGDDVAEVVKECTDDKSLDKPERKRLQVEHAPHKSPRAALVKAADKICNLRDVAASPPQWPVERKREYFEWAASVVRGLPALPPALVELFEQAYARKAELA